ncbi:MAG: SpoIIE family protein phosphatase [Planctomycetes bacterium]|nr:SpoIIE family protein phosphatase [Planctomycetota bacterium]
MGGEKILVVDDDRVLAGMLDAFLSDAGYGARVAHDAAGARELLAAGSFDVLLADVLLPGGEDGLSIFRHARSLSPSLQTVLMTGHATVDSAIAAVRDGAYDYLVKPLDMKELRRTVERAIQKQNADRRNEALTALLKIGHAINSIDEPERLLERILDIVVQGAGASGGSILLYEAGSDDLRIGASFGVDGILAQEVRVRPGERISGWVLERNQPVLVNGPASDHPLFRHLPPRAGIASSLVLPLCSKGRRIGVLAIHRARGAGRVPEPFTEADLEAFRIFADTIAVAINNGRMLAELREARSVLERQKENLARQNRILAASNRLLSEDNIRREQELRMASEVQKAFLPGRDLDVPGFDLAAMLVPMHGVAGDFYAYRLSPGGDSLELRIGDVCGHGVPSALVMVLTETLFHNFQDAEIPLGEALGRVNTGLLGYFQDQRENFVTVFAGLLDVPGRRLVYAKAGHPPPLLARRRTGEVETLEADGIFLGAFPCDRFEEREVVLEPGDLLLLYTDGVVEALDRSGEKFGLDRLIRGVRSNLHLTGHGQLRRVLRELREHTGDVQPDDDRTLVALRVEEEGTRVEGVGGSRAQRDGWIALRLAEAEALGHPEAWRQELGVALAESLANALDHGHGGDERRSIEVRHRIGLEKALFSITDGGRGFAAPPVEGEVDARSSGMGPGRGIARIREAVDEVSWNSTGNRISLVKYRRPSANA